MNHYCKLVLISRLGTYKTVEKSDVSGGGQSFEDIYDLMHVAQKGPAHFFSFELILLHYF